MNGSSWFMGALALIFITLKLCSVIDWSWWLVTLPLWGFAALYLVIGLFCVIEHFSLKIHASMSVNKDKPD